ncbi:hypothetical protein [Belnapia sp. F-4-1]|uniref:hypothetical protein n=1 Tax=Belnapia sp. F-4-1 TaxID=1545443 RepID=UPI0005BD58E4|nr:hypothetical protein [Belnapia sp. F-4-1]
MPHYGDDAATTAKQDNRHAAGKQSGEGGTSNAGGTAPGPCDSSASVGKDGEQCAIAGSGDETTHNRPGRKTQG